MITMTGFDRQFEVPQYLRSLTASADVNHPVLRKIAMGRVTVWDMLSPVVASTHPLVCAWGQRLVDSVITASAAPGVEALDCPDCEDTGYYGVPDSSDSDILRMLLRRDGEELHSLAADGTWSPWEGTQDIEMLDLEIAEDMASAVLAGATGMARRYWSPLAFLSPDSLIAAADPATALDSAEAGDGWHYFAIVDDLDTGAVLNLVRIKAGPTMEKYEQNDVWSEDNAILTELRGVKPPPLVELDETQLSDVISQIDSGAVAKDEGTDAPAEGSDPAAEATDAPQTASGLSALAADAPLTVSPDPRAEKLRRYWSTGKGGLKIRWNTPGDWTRCYRQLKKHMGERAKGYCANLHKRNTGKWTGSKLNASAGMMVMSTEEALVASVRAGTWTGHSERVLNMVGIKDGVYEESVGEDHSVLRSLTAGGFPVEPPTEWFENPMLSSLTPLTVEDNGHVFGHLASFDMPHIGMPGKVRAPRSRSNYSFFKSGQLRTASGAKVDVGQLTLVGGHAPLSATAASAQKHYDDTNSAVADVNIGEDRHGIWFSGALRPDVSPAQVRAFMASALSGDWRPINGNLELVAACSVNVPGFPIAKTLVAGGAVMALVAAGARPIALKQLARASDAAVLERLEAIEAILSDGNLMVLPNEVSVDDIVVDPDALVEADESEVDAADRETLDAMERDLNLPDPVDIREPVSADTATPGVSGISAEPGAPVSTEAVNPKREAARALVAARKKAARLARVHGTAANAEVSDDNTADSTDDAEADRAARRARVHGASDLT